MKLSEMAGKEIINVFDGSRLGVIGQADLVVDAQGYIKSIIMPQRNNFLNFWTEREQVIIPWSAVRKVGSETVIVDIDRTVPKINPYY